MLAVIMGWDSVELESSLGKIFSKIPSLNASHKGSLVVFSSEKEGAVHEQGWRTMKEDIAETRRRQGYLGFH